MFSDTHLRESEKSGSLYYIISGIHFKIEVYAFSLPIYYFIDYFSLLNCSFSEINTGCFNTFVFHKVSKKSYIVTSFKKAFRKSKAKRMRINHIRGYSILILLILLACTYI